MSATTPCSCTSTTSSSCPEDSVVDNQQDPDAEPAMETTDVPTSSSSSASASALASSGGEALGCAPASSTSWSAADSTEFAARRLANIALMGYTQQRETMWPKGGRAVVAQYNDEAILVYQAYCHSIADYAVKNQKFEGCPDWQSTRMTWIKPNFLWMMYRSNWANRKGQERILGIWMRRDAFEHILKLTLHSSYDPDAYDNPNDYRRKAASAKSSGRYVRIQWDPDHHPDGSKLGLRRDIQLGLKSLDMFANGTAFLAIVDATPIAKEQYRHVLSREYDQLQVPLERVYPVPGDIARHLGMSL
ncbi:DUF4291 family protein [Pelomyxa schiedti]|nr:DUF4291 family protein [Pelomyxa schiedti]